MDSETAAASMKPKSESLILAGVCLIMLLLSLAGLVWAMLPGQRFTLDGILLTLICLATAGIFAGLLAVQAVQEGWIKLPVRKSGDAPKPPGVAGK